MTLITVDTILFGYPPAFPNFFCKSAGIQSIYAVGSGLEVMVTTGARHSSVAKIWLVKRCAF